MENYVISESGTAFKVGTDRKVMEILDNAITSRNHPNRKPVRLRIWYGDTKTGRDWMEVYDTIGYIGRSMGEYKVPLLIKKNNSMGGGAILTDRIVKITRDKEVVYKHPKYHQPELVIKEGEMPDGDSGFMVFAGSDVLLRCCNKRQEAEREIAFHKGLRNRA